MAERTIHLPVEAARLLRQGGTPLVAQIHSCLVPDGPETPPPLQSLRRGPEFPMAVEFLLNRG